VTLVTVAAYSKAEEAYLAASLLESCEIPVFVKDAHTVQMYWFYSNAIGGVKVQVPPEHLEEAKKILGETVSAGPEEPAAVGGLSRKHTLWSVPVAIFVFLLLFFRMDIVPTPVPGSPSPMGGEPSLSLIPAIQQGKPVPAIERLIDANPEALHETQRGEGVLLIAALAGDPEVLELLLRNHFRGDRISRHRVGGGALAPTILHRAIARHDSRSARLMLDYLEVTRDDLLEVRLDLDESLRRSHIDEDLKARIRAIMEPSP